MQIIGICGRKGSGKSTLAGQIGGMRLPFAHFLKEGLIAMGVPEEAIYDPIKKEEPLDILQGKSGRYAMQTLGTEWGRGMMGPEFWTDLWLHAVMRLHSETCIVVDDVRFPQEVQMIRDLGGMVFAVVRGQIPEHSNNKWVRMWQQRNIHPSERLVYEDYDIPIILNNSTPENLFAEYNHEMTSENLAQRYGRDITTPRGSPPNQKTGLFDDGHTGA